MAQPQLHRNLEKIRRRGIRDAAHAMARVSPTKSYNINEVRETPEGRLDFGDVYWLVWLGLFLLLEIPAAIWRSRWTLSHHVWKWFAIKGPARRYKVLRWVILFGTGVATVAHFSFNAPAWPIIVFGAGCAWSIWHFYSRELPGGGAPGGADPEERSTFMTMPATPSPVTRKAWDEEHKACLRRMMTKKPTSSLEWRRSRCFAITEAKLGPRPPSLAGAIIKATAGYLKSGGDMGFKKSIMWKKALKAAAFGAGVVFLASFDAPQEWVDAGAPEWIAPLGAVIVGGAIKALHNYLKVGKRVNLP